MVLTWSRRKRSPAFNNIHNIHNTPENVRCCLWQSREKANSRKKKVLTGLAVCLYGKKLCPWSWVQPSAKLNDPLSVNNAGLVDSAVWGIISLLLYVLTSPIHYSKKPEQSFTKPCTRFSLTLLLPWLSETEFISIMPTQHQVDKNKLLIGDF